MNNSLLSNFHFTKNITVFFMLVSMQRRQMVCPGKYLVNRNYQNVLFQVLPSRKTRKTDALVSPSFHPLPVIFICIY